MSIFTRQKQKKAKTPQPTTVVYLGDLPYADIFDLPREEEKLRAVYEHDRVGGNFDVRKVFASKGMKSMTIATVAHFPDYFDVVDMVEERFGGGIYNIHPAGRPRVFKSYIIDGPSVYKVDKPEKAMSPVQKLKAELEEAALHKLREMVDEDPVVGRAFAAALFKKHSGVELPAEPTWEEKLLQVAVEGDAEYREGLIRARLRERGVEFPEERDPFERLITEAEQTNRLREALGGGRKGIAGIARELIPAIPVLLQILRNAQGGTTAETPIGPALDTTADATVAAEPAKQPVEPIAAPAPIPALPEIMRDEIAQTPLHLLPDILPGDNGAGVPPLDRVDWVELEIGVHSAPEAFIQGMYRTGNDQDNLYHRQLAKLFQDNLPDDILTKLSLLAESEAVVSGEDYEIAVLVLKHLDDTEAGRLWLNQAHTAAQATQVRVDQDEPGEIGLMDHGDDDEEFDDPMLV